MNMFHDGPAENAELSALIWDLDGTLFDSYPIIVSSLAQALRESGFPADEDIIHAEITERSVDAYITDIAGAEGFAALKSRYSAINAMRDGEIRPIKNAGEILRLLSDAGAKNFVYTHKGAAADFVLENLGLRQFFTEVVTAQAGFPRKPSPDAVLYLVEKYGLAPERTFYAGDRTLDIECAKNAGIRSILYADGSRAAEPENADFTVHDLIDIRHIFNI